MTSEISAVTPVPPRGLSPTSSAECRASINSTQPWLTVPAAPRSHGPVKLVFVVVMLLCSCRHLAGEVAKEWQEIDEADKAQRDTLLTLVKEIVPYNMAHNAEHEACDLLMEIEQMDMLEKYIDDNAYSKVCLYLTR